MKTKHTEFTRSTIRISYRQLKQLTVDLLAINGVAPPIAKKLAAILVEADLWGNPEHGVAMLPRFIALQKAGKIDFSRKTRLIKETPAHIALDAKNQIGPVALLAMTSQTILKAQSKGIAVGTVRSIIDQGMTSYYAYKAARAGCVALLFSQASNTQSKPLAAAFPRSSGLDPIFLTLDGGSDSSLGLLTLAFAGVLSGNSFSKNLGSTTMIVIDPKVFGEHREITREVSQLSLELKKLAGGGDNRMASDRTMAYKTQCLKHGVPIDSATLETLRGLLQKSLVSKSMISKLA